MQRPKQRHRHEQEHEIDKDVAKAEDVLHVVRLRFAHRGRSDSQGVVERRGQRLAGEADQEDGDECPNAHDGADGPRHVAEFRADFEDAVDEDQDGEFGQGDRDDVEQAIDGYKLWTIVKIG